MIFGVATHTVATYLHAICTIRSPYVVECIVYTVLLFLTIKYLTAIIQVVKVCSLLQRKQNHTMIVILYIFITPNQIPAVICSIHITCNRQIVYVVLLYFSFLCTFCGVQ
uniref:Uncharacterized protein n=1 Tax=Pararge aegeria TaxID=116150 RepID=S4NL12_9NEOP